MHISITTRHAGISEEVKNYARQKLDKMGSIWVGDAAVHLIIDSERSGFTAEINLHTGHSRINCRARNREVQAAVDKAVRKAEKCLRKLKDKYDKRRKKMDRISPPHPAAIPADIPRLIKVDDFVVKTLNEREASLHMRASTLNFLIYRDSASNKLSVVYRRQDGNLGLIELED